MPDKSEPRFAHMSDKAQYDANVAAGHPICERCDGSGNELYAKTITVCLTVTEARALRLASIFGSPTPDPPEITSARAKLNEAERLATTGKGT